MTATVSHLTAVEAADVLVSEHDIACPLLCGGESSLIIRGWGKPVTVHPCAKCAAMGGTAFDVRFTDAEHYMARRESSVWQHRDGLVTFR